MADANHAREDIYEIAQSAARPVALDRSGASVCAIGRNGNPDAIGPSSDSSRPSPSVSAGGKQSLLFEATVAFTVDLTDDRALDAIADLVLLLSQPPLGPQCTGQVPAASACISRRARGAAL